MTTFKQEFLEAHGVVIQSICNLLMVVPVDVEKMNFTPYSGARPLHELIKHLQQIELDFIRGCLKDDWDRENIPWHVGKNQPMVDQLLANHREALDMLEAIDEAEFLSREIQFSYVKGPLAKMLFDGLDHLSHHRTQLYTYLKLLGILVDTKTFWETH